MSPVYRFAFILIGLSLISCRSTESSALADESDQAAYAKLFGQYKLSKYRGSKVHAAQQFGDDLLIRKPELPYYKDYLEAWGYQQKAAGRHWASRTVKDVWLAWNGAW